MSSSNGSFNSMDRLVILSEVGIVPGIYADHRGGGRVIIDHPKTGGQP